MNTDNPHNWIGKGIYSHEDTCMLLRAFKLVRGTLDVQDYSMLVPEAISFRELMLIVTYVATVNKTGTDFSKSINSLISSCDFDDCENIARWYPMHPNRRVVLDPHLKFGAPTIREFGIRTQVLMGQVNAGDSILAVAEYFDISVEDVEAAVEFHTRGEKDKGDNQETQ